MVLPKSKKNDFLPFLLAGLLFVLGCLLQEFDDSISNWNASRIMSISAQFVFLGIFAYWTVSVINRVSDKETRRGVASTIILMSSVMLLKLIKYNVVYEEKAERYLWYSYYIPQCLAPVILFLTTLKMGRKGDYRLSRWWNILFLPGIFLILFVFTNDLHEQVFSFPLGLANGNSPYRWEWGYYVVLVWISALYFLCGLLLFFKCRVSLARKRAWIPLSLFACSVALIILREVLNPSFIKMPEAVTFALVVVFESLIRIGFVPSNVDYGLFFDASLAGALIENDSFEVRLRSKNAYEISKEESVEALRKGVLPLSKDATLKGKKIRGGAAYWTVDASSINRINESLFEIGNALEEEIVLVRAENRLKEQQTRIEEQSKLYEEVYKIARSRFRKIEDALKNAKAEQEKEQALRLASLYGAFLKRRSNLVLIGQKGRVSLSELGYSLKEACDALSFYGVPSSFVMEGDGDWKAEEIDCLFDFFEMCIEISLSSLKACFVRLERKEKTLFIRLAMEGMKGFDARIKETLEGPLKPRLSFEEDEGTLYVALSFREGDGL